MVLFNIAMANEQSNRQKQVNLPCSNAMTMSQNPGTPITLNQPDVGKMELTEEFSDILYNAGPPETIAFSW